MGDADIVCAETLELGLVPTDIEVSTETAFKIPFDQLPALGGCFLRNRRRFPNCHRRFWANSFHGHQCFWKGDRSGEVATF